MSQAKHIGKIVLSMLEPPAVAGGAGAPLTLHPDATYLIAGGLGGFGLTVARWMVERGARHLVLLGRRGASTPEAEQGVAALRQTGARVVVAQADVAVPADLAGVLSKIGPSMPPVRGVVQSAMVLEDCLLGKLDRERLERVLRPKVRGSWNLHCQTLDCPLDFFVLFSSMTSQFGLPGQANYAAANAFQDALAHYRRAQGLPSLVINWGYLADVGYVARNQRTAERLEGQGLRSFTPAQALAILDGLLQQGAVQAGVANIDWGHCNGPGVLGFHSPRFSCLSQGVTAERGERPQADMDIRKVVLAAAPDKRQELLVSFLRDKLAQVLGAPAAKVDVDKPLTDLGMDSLMAVELRNWIEGSLRVTLPIVELMQGPTMTRLAELLLGQLIREEPGPATPVPAAAVPQTVAAPVVTQPLTTNGSSPATPVGAGASAIDRHSAGELLGKLDALSDAEVDSLLNSMLSEGKAERA
jgi:NADP-dependent 3-hydroxy acid dehydrogenase YdfG/acyl carrier protein